MAGERADRIGAPYAFHHRLHERELFQREALVEVLDRYPRDAMGVFAMGADPSDWRSWRRGEAFGLTGEDLMAAAEQGRIWLNLRGMNDVFDAYGALVGEMFARSEGLTFRHDVGLLISSPGAHVAYHFDAAPVTLWQVRGKKRMWVYPARTPFVAPEQVEALVLGESVEQAPHDPAWDAEAAVFDLSPGLAVRWPQNAPHRVVNGDGLNVSLSVEHLTWPALMRANVHYANGLMRRLGARPAIRDGHGPGNLAKFCLARLAKAIRRPRVTRLPVSFRLDPEWPGRLIEP